MLGSGYTQLPEIWRIRADPPFAWRLHPERITAGDQGSELVGRSSWILNQCSRVHNAGRSRVGAAPPWTNS